MAFVKTAWVDRVTAVSAAQLNRIEQGIDDAHSGKRQAVGAFRGDNAVAATIGSGGNGNVATFTSEVFDVSGWYDAPNSRFLPTLGVPAYYMIVLRIVTAQVLAVGTNLEARINKSGVSATPYAVNRTQAGNATSSVFVEVAAPVLLNGTTDYVEGWAWHDYGSARNVSGVFSGFLIGTT